MIIDLFKEYGKKFVVVPNEDHIAERGNNHKRSVDPYNWIILCRASSKAYIFPWDETRLAISRDVPGRKNVINRRLLALSTARMEQDGSDGVNISFAIKELPKVNRIVGFRRCRKGDISHLQQYQFTKKEAE